MSHTPPPPRNSGNTLTGLTDTTIVADQTKAKAVHITELRTKLNAEFTRRTLSPYNSWTDASLTTGDRIRKVHIDELRTQLAACKSGWNCVTDDSGCMDFTDPSIVAGTTRVRAVHITDIRTKLQNLMTGCICEIEQCQYCADCGYYYTKCAHKSVACDDHKYGECSHSIYTGYSCASVNLAPMTTHPYKQSLCSHPDTYGVTSCTHTSVAWDGTVPWDICNYAPPGSVWGTCEYLSGHNHSEWNCKCNPYTMS